MYEETYVTFETAKLLKEKGFIGCGEIGCTCGFYSETAYEHGHGIITESGQEVGLVFDDLDNSELEFNEYLRPTQQTALKWLREEHGKHVDFLYRPFEIYHGDSYLWETFEFPQGRGRNSTFEECCEEAIKYCLKQIEIKIL